MERFLRTEILLGKENLIKLQKAKVLVCGAGAVGSYAIEALARAGVGNICIVDFDKVEISNINRQLYALTSTIGKYKADLALKRVLDINPNCKVYAKKIFINSDTLSNIFEYAPDFTIDAIDSLNPKVNLLEYLHNKKIKHISSMGAARRTNPNLIQYGDLFQVKNCPLARFIRKRLRRRGINSGISVVYSKELKSKKSVTGSNSAINEIGRPRQILGSLPTITGIFGLYLAHYTIDSLINTH